MTERELAIRTMRVYDEYERRFAAARAGRPLREMWREDDRADALRAVREVLVFRDELIPQVRIRSENTVQMDGFTITDTVWEGWSSFFGVFSLFRPAGGGRRPTIFVCPGHGKQGRLTPGYQAMAARLVRQGANVILVDNIGQGERLGQGHWDVVVPFACGLTLQGMILMETVALIRWAAAQDFCDPARMGACGNSGGGTLTTFLCALAPELAAIASCGYPSQFDYIFQKERKHCACNLLPHVCAKLDMWEVLSLFAPKPLLIEMGTFDNLFGQDYFLRCARKVKTVYGLMDAGNAFHHKITKTEHPWDVEDRALIGNFFADVFGELSRTDEGPERAEDLRDPLAATVVLPAGGLKTDGVAMAITGKSVPADIRLDEVVPIPGDILPDLGRGDTSRVLAQFEMTL